MAILEFIEDADPQLPPRPPPPQPAPAPPASSSSKRTSTSSSSVAMLDLTGSPPPVSPPKKKLKVDTAQQLDEWFGDDAPQPASTSAAAGGRQGQAGMAGARRVVHTGAPPASSAVGQQAFPSTNSGFAKYATAHSPTAGSPSSAKRASASTSSFRQPPITSEQVLGLGGANRIPIISSASSARVPSARLPGQPSPTAGAGAGAGPGSKNYYRMQAAAVSTSLATVAAQVGLNPLPPGKRANSLNALVSSSGSASAGLSRSNTLPSAYNSSGVIDLTDDASPPPDDDLIIPHNQPSTSPICIGQLTSLALILYPVVELLPPPPLDSNDEPLPPEQAARAPPPPPQSLTPLPIHILRADPQGANETLKLVTPGRRETFGVMEHRVANVVAGLFGEGWTGTGVGVPMGRGGSVWCEARVVRRGERNPMMLPLQLLLFTLPHLVPKVSSTLEKAALFLEHPASYNPSQHSGAAYANPHNPMVGGGPGGLGSRGPNNPGGYGIPRRPLGMQVESSAEMQRRDVESTLMQLKSGTDLEESTPPPIVTTALYPHQKQALTFLLHREALVDVPDVDEDPQNNPTTVALWRRVSDTYGRPTGWRSIVTEQEVVGREGVPQARGAILADDMGLGKTIVIISLIATTLPLSILWAQQPPSKDTHDLRFDSIRSTAASSSKPKLSLSDFSSNLYGLADSGPGTISAPPLAPGGPPLGANGRPLSKKALAKRKREMKKEDEEGRRFEKLLVRSRATLIVCPLSTVQNWESQLEEHTKVAGVRRGKKGRKVVVSKGDGEEEYDGEGKRRSGRATKGKRRAADDSEDDDDASFAGSSPFSSAHADESDDDDPSSTADACPFSIYIYHGNNRTPDPNLLADHDVVITTFSTLGTEFSKQQRAEEEREEEAAALAKEAEGEEDELMQVFGYDADGKVIETRPGEDVVKPGKPLKKRKKLRKKVEGVGTSPLQQVQWWRVVLDEAHIIKEHTTIQARAACELSAQRRIALSGTPLQNSLNDLFSLVRFLRLEPFTDRSVWTQHIGALVKAGNNELGIERLQLIMRYLTLRRTKESTDKDGRPILALPPVSHRVIKLKLDPAEEAFYWSHHQRYKHAFLKLEETDSVMKNFCSILQEILRLRQICVHMALVKDSEDLGGDLICTIEKHGISKPRAIQLLSLMREAGAATCAECGVEMLPGGQVGDQQQEEDVKPDLKKKAPAKRVRKAAASTSASASASAINSEDDIAASISSSSGIELHSVVTRCQHLFCRACFVSHVYPGWPNKVVSNDRASCSVCRGDLTPALDAVEVGANEFEKAVAAEEDGEDIKPGRGGGGGRGKNGAADKKGKATTRFFEHSTKTKALINDLLPFSRANPASLNYWGGMDDAQAPDDTPGGTIGFQPVKGEVVKSVVFSQWTKLLDRLGDALDQEQIGYYRLDGGMNRDQRNRSMEAFKVDPRCEVLLVSLRAGGVGLNLTAGRRVYLMEPFWNPAVENQAVDRVYRLGQTKPVQTVRFVIDGSIEERMLKIQEKKMNLAANALKQSMSKAELQAQRKSEFKFLLGGGSEDGKDSM